MHVQVINFNLKDVSEVDYRALCDQLAPLYAAIPGLIAKVWLADANSNTYGGVYTWQDRRAMETFQQTELFHNVLNHPNLANISSKDFGVLEAPTEVTKGLAISVP